MDVTYLGSGNSVLAVAGQCNQGGNIVIWDTQRPLSSGPVARLSYHLAAVTALKVSFCGSQTPGSTSGSNFRACVYSQRPQNAPMWQTDLKS